MRVPNENEIVGCMRNCKYEKNMAIFGRKKSTFSQTYYFQSPNCMFECHEGNFWSALDTRAQVLVWNKIIWIVKMPIKPNKLFLVNQNMLTFLHFQSRIMTFYCLFRVWYNKKYKLGQNRIKIRQTKGKINVANSF